MRELLLQDFRLLVVHRHDLAYGQQMVPLQQHIGARCEPTVAIGDYVTVGQVIADTDAFSHLKGKRDDRTFFEKLAVAPDYTKERFESVDEAIKSQSVLKLGAGKKVRAYKYKNNSAVKMYLRGKTLNLYLALDPKEFIDSKYKYTDASDTKKYSATPMRIKLTSNRQVKHAIELIRLLVEKLEKGVNREKI